MFTYIRKSDIPGSGASEREKEDKKERRGWTNQQAGDVQTDREQSKSYRWMCACVP